MTSTNRLLYLLPLLVLGCATSKPGFDDVNVAHNACYSYSYGENGFELDYKKAFEWCSIAAELGSSSAQTLLAELYLFGNGVNTDLHQASKYYELAAFQSHPHAQLMYFMVNNVYLADQSSDEAKEKGINFLRVSADSGYKKAIEVQTKYFGQKI